MPVDVRRLGTTRIITSVPVDVFAMKDKFTCYDMIMMFNVPRYRQISRVFVNLFSSVEARFDFMILHVNTCEKRYKVSIHFQVLFRMIGVPE